MDFDCSHNFLDSLCRTSVLRYQGVCELFYSVQLILKWTKLLLFKIIYCLLQSTSNYHARKFGVRAAMPGFIGKKLCPELVIVPLNFEKYTAVSKQVRAIMSEYDPNFCPMSLDEAYLDLTEHLQNRKDMSEDERTYICRDSKYADSRAHCKCDLTEIARNYGNDTIIQDGSNLNEYFSKNHHFEADTDSSLDENVASDKMDKNVVICPVCKKMLPPFKRATFGLSDEDAVNEMRSRIEQKTTLTASAGNVYIF